MSGPRASVIEESSIESGFPTILALQSPNEGHAIAVLGHTLNSDRWTPEARRGYGVPPITPYIATSAWADHLVVADDNYGMYVALPSEALKTLPPPAPAGAPAGPLPPDLYALLAIGLVPKGIDFPGYYVEQIAAYLAATLINFSVPGNRWIDLLKPSAKGGREYALVCRTLLVGKADYIAAMNSAADESGHMLGANDTSWFAQLPDRFWVTEITLAPLLAGNKRKLGDILIRVDKYATTNAAEYLIFAWLPGAAYIGPSSHLASWLGPMSWSFCGHIPVLRGSGQSKPRLEW